MESNKTKQESKVKQLKQNRLVVSREKGWVDVTSEGGQKVQTSNYKINKPCGYNLQHGDESCCFVFFKKRWKSTYKGYTA